MPTYAFRCEGCGASPEFYAPISEGPPPHPVCPSCETTALVRIYSIAIPKPYEPHWNKSVGKYVQNDREFRDALKVASEEQSRRTGYDTNYVPVPWAEIDYTPDEAQLKGRRDRGETSSTKTVIV